MESSTAHKFSPELKATSMEASKKFDPELKATSMVKSKKFDGANYV
jgi:hypothetical protein